ncbi:MAG: DsbE family thiol:disulfide interchange protein, partial [Gammaproteobacteria bacterium]|nr:DsbE family thiol:disulfide interchange protein [Gammaproteobacteria bacterium]
WLAQLGNPYEAVAVDATGRTAIDWGVYGAPETFLVSPQGIVVYKHVGALTDEVWVHDILPRVAPAPASRS